MFSNLKFAAIGIGIALLLTACGSSGATKSAGSEPEPTTNTVASAASTVDPIALDEPLVRQFCNVGSTFKEAREAGISYFGEDSVESNEAFEELWSAHVVMLGWGPEALTADLELISSALNEFEFVFFSNDYDPSAVLDDPSGEELAALQRFSDGDAAASIDRIVATWEYGCDPENFAAAEPETPTTVAPATTIPETSDDAFGATTTTVATASEEPFCLADRAVTAAIDKVIDVGRDGDRPAFFPVLTELSNAQVEWNPPVDLVSASIALRNKWIEAGSVFPQTGEPAETAAAFEALDDDAEWQQARAEIDSWLADNC